MPAYNISGTPLTDTPLIESAKRLGVHLMPTTLGELNMVKRARQMTDIKWTPAMNLKRRNSVEYDQELNWPLRFEDRFTAGVEYRGLPYSHGYYNGANRNFGMIGYQIPFDAFISSLGFANSYLATNHWDTTNGVYTTYGVTCDTLGCYAMGLSTWYGSDTGFASLVSNGTLVSKFSGDSLADHIDEVHLGDILWKQAVHVAVITDVVIDDEGNIFIEVSEATTAGATSPEVLGGQFGGLCRRELWSLDDDFYTRFYGYTVYRYANSASVTYEQSRFVTLEGESPLHDLHDRMPLIPYMGDGMKYLSGHIPASTILIGTDEYAYLAVYKDGSAWKNITLNGATSKDVEFSATGNYEAFLYNSTDGSVANMTNRTVSCTWSVVS